MRVAVPRQLALGLADLPVPACRWQAFPEETRTQVLGLLARLIAAAPWPRTHAPRPVSDDRSEVGGGIGAVAAVVDREGRRVTPLPGCVCVCAPINTVTDGSSHRIPCPPVRGA